MINDHGLFSDKEGSIAWSWWKTSRSRKGL